MLSVVNIFGIIIALIALTCAYLVKIDVYNFPHAQLVNFLAGCVGVTMLFL